MKNVTHQSIDRQPKKGTESRVSNEKKSELQATMIRGMKRKDGLEKQLQIVQEKESK